MDPPTRLWRKTDRWTRATDGSQNFAVECPTSGEFGVAKSQNREREMLAWCLACAAHVPVPEAELGECEGTAIFVSRSWGTTSCDARSLKEKSEVEYESEAFREGARRASGLLVFRAWLGIDDSKDEQVVVKRGATAGTYELAGVDFADAFQFEGATEQVTLPSGPAVLVDNRGAQQIRDTINDIQAISDEWIRTEVDSHLGDAFSKEHKARIARKLIERKGALESVFRPFLNPQSVAA